MRRLRLWGVGENDKGEEFLIFTSSTEGFLIGKVEDREGLRIRVIKREKAETWSQLHCLLLTCGIERLYRLEEDEDFHYRFDHDLDP